MAAKHLSNKDFNEVLPKEVSEKYQIKNMEKRTSTHIVHPKFGEIDFSKMTLKHAEFFVKQKADFIEAKPLKK